MKNNFSEFSRFTEFCKAYISKTYFYLWGFNIGIFIFGLIMRFPFLMSPLFMAVVMLWFVKSLGLTSGLNWSSQKIENLLRYKQLTGEAFTPLEREVLNRYFGKHQRKELILDQDVKRKWWRYIRLITIHTFLFAVIGVILILIT